MLARLLAHSLALVPISVGACDRAQLRPHGPQHHHRGDLEHVHGSSAGESGITTTTTQYPTYHGPTHGPTHESIAVAITPFQQCITRSSLADSSAWTIPYGPPAPLSSLSPLHNPSLTHFLPPFLHDRHGHPHSQPLFYPNGGRSVGITNVVQAQLRARVAESAAMHSSMGLSGESLDYLTSYDSSDKVRTMRHDSMNSKLSDRFKPFQSPLGI